MQNIGVFDSGLGGLSVLKKLLDNTQDKHYIYLGDTLRLPYGNKSPHTIAKYVQRNVHFLKKQNAEQVVIACNSASSAILTHPWAESPLPLVEIVTPGVKLALKYSTKKHIAVIGTEATIKNNLYKKYIKHHSPISEVTSIACPLFVPLVENGEISGPIINAVIHKYLAPLKDRPVDLLILGCTHYPFLKPALNTYLGPTVNILDPSDHLHHFLKPSLMANTSRQSKASTFNIYTTDQTSSFAKLARNFLKPYDIDAMKDAEI